MRLKCSFCLPRYILQNNPPSVDAIMKERTMQLNKTHIRYLANCKCATGLSLHYTKINEQVRTTSYPRQKTSGGSLLTASQGVTSSAGYWPLTFHDPTKILKMQITTKGVRQLKHFGLRTITTVKPLLIISKQYHADKWWE